MLREAIWKAEGVTIDLFLEGMYEGFKNSIGATVQNAAGIDQGRPTRAVKADLEGYFLSIHQTSSHREQLIFILHVQRRWGILVLPCLFAHLSV